MSDIEKATEGGAEFIAAQQAEYAAEQAAEAARAAAVVAGYPRVMTSGGARDGTTVYPSVVTLQWDTEAEAVAAIAAARAEGRYINEDQGPVFEGNGGWNAAIELDPSTRYPLGDHTGGR